MPNEPLRILAVDDVMENLVALEAALDQPGVELVTAQSGFEALELMLRDDFALALLDVQMPEMDGFELAELMRGTERTRGVPIIFLTAIAKDEQRRFRGFETGAVDYLHKPLDITILNSKIAVFIELARQRREIANQRDALGMALGRLRAYGDNSPLATIEVDADLRIVSWYKGAERTIGFSMDDMIGRKLTDVPFLASEDRDPFIATIHELLGSEEGRLVTDHRFRRADGMLREGEWYCTALPGYGRESAGTMLSMIDVTERRRAEQTQRLLIGELNHRVKNTLATVQAIASQGLRHARSPKDFQEAFTGRLQALSRAHSLLSATTWESASLRRLVAEQVAIGAISEDRLVLDGSDVNLPPELALRFSLILHELATNAHKYGALSNEIGTVRLSWHRRADWLVLTWTERGGPPVHAPEQRGFGSTLIRESMAADGAHITAAFALEGVSWQLEVPLVCTGAENDETGAAPLVSPAAGDAGGMPDMSGLARVSPPGEPMQAPGFSGEPLDVALVEADNDRLAHSQNAPALAVGAAIPVAPALQTSRQTSGSAGEPPHDAPDSARPLPVVPVASDAPATGPATAQGDDTARESTRDTAPARPDAATTGFKVLIVEDEPLVAMELAMEIEDAGGLPLGPATSCEQALSMIARENPDVALLDGNLNGERITPVADELAARATPFAFVSGYDREHLPENHAQRPMIAKPFMGSEVSAMITRLSQEAHSGATRVQPVSGEN